MHLKHSQTTVSGGVLTQVVVFLVCASVVVAVGWLVLLPGLFTSVIQNRTGFPARIDYFYANPFTAEVRMRGFTLMNPAGFAERNCIEVRQFTAKADLFSLLGREPILDFSTIDVGRLTLATNSNGTTNLDVLSNRFSPAPASQLRSAAQSKAVVVADDKPLQFLIRHLDVRINEVVLKDERTGKTKTEVHPLAFHRSYRNVTPETKFNRELPPEVNAVGDAVGVRVAGVFKGLFGKMLEPIPQKTYAWGELQKKEEKSTPPTSELEEKPKP